MKKILSIITILTLILSGCSSNNSDKVKIVTTIYPLYNITEQQLADVDKEKYELINIYPADIDPHSYQLTPQNIKDIADADYVIYISDHFEEWIVDTQTNGQKVSVTEAESFVNKAGDNLYENDQIIDPHVFISPKYLNYINEVIKDTLNDSKLKDDSINKNYQTLNDELTEMDNKYKTFGENFDKTIITSHDAFSHLNEYGINTLGLYGQHHDDEPSSQDVSNTIELIKDQNIKTIYNEQNEETNELMTQIAKESNSEISTLNNMSSVSKADFDKHKSIITILQENLDELEKA